MARNYLRVLYDTSPLERETISQTLHCVTAGASLGVNALSEKDGLIRRVENCLREVAQLREKNQELEGEMFQSSTSWKVEETRCEEEVRT
jgi:hypothetical protein